MTSPRLTSRITIDALFRRVRAAGGFATVIARGDDSAGSILIACSERGEVKALLERTIDLEGDYRWTRCGPDGPDPGATRDSYIRRRCDRDPDLWLIELDIPDAERFVAETDPLC